MNGGYLGRDLLYFSKIIFTKMNKIITACSLIIVIIFTSCGDRVRGNGNEKTETRSVGVAKEIAMSGSFNVILIEVIPVRLK
jgi:hypothetical protein